MLKYAPWTLSRGYNIEMGRGGQNVRIGDRKTRAFNETGRFGVSQLILSMIVEIKTVYTLHTTNLPEGYSVLTDKHALSYSFGLH